MGEFYLFMFVLFEKKFCLSDVGGAEKKSQEMQREASLGFFEINRLSANRQSSNYNKVLLAF